MNIRWAPSCAQALGWGHCGPATVMCSWWLESQHWNQTAWLPRGCPCTGDGCPALAFSPSAALTSRPHSLWGPNPNPPTPSFPHLPHYHPHPAPGSSALVLLWLSSAHLHQPPPHSPTSLLAVYKHAPVSPVLKTNQNTSLGPVLRLQHPSPISCFPHSKTSGKSVLFSSLHSFTPHFSPPPMPSQHPSPSLPKTVLARVPSDSMLPNPMVLHWPSSHWPPRSPERLLLSLPKLSSQDTGFSDAASDLAAASHLLSPISQTVLGSAPLLHLLIPKFTSSPIALNTIRMLVIVNHIVFTRTYHRTCILSRFSCVQPALCNPMDCSPPGSSVHGILQERKLEWVAMPSSRGSSWPSSQSHMSWGSSIGRRILYHWARREACTYCYILTSLILKFM